MQRKVTICPVCQNEQIEWDYRFCPICGNPVKEKAPDVLPDNQSARTNNQLQGTPTRFGCQGHGRT